MPSYMSGLTMCQQDILSLPENLRGSGAGYRCSSSGTRTSKRNSRSGEKRARTTNIGARRDSPRERLISRWQERWDSATSVRWTHALTSVLSPWLERRHGQVDFDLTQIVSGHWCFRSYLKKYGHDTKDGCPFCGSGIEEDARHVQFEYVRFVENRTALETATGASTSPRTLVPTMQRGRMEWDATAKFAPSLMRKLRIAERERRGLDTYAATVVRIIALRPYRTTSTVYAHLFICIFVSRCNPIKKKSEYKKNPLSERHTNNIVHPLSHILTNNIVHYFLVYNTVYPLLKVQKWAGSSLQHVLFLWFGKKQHINRRNCFCTDSIRSMCTWYWGLQTEEQYSKLGRTSEVNNNLVVYGSSNSLDQRFINPNLSLGSRRTPKSFTEYFGPRTCSEESNWWTLAYPYKKS